MATPLHPKVAAAGTAAGVVAVITAILAVAGVTLNGDLVQALAVIIAAVLPVLAGYAKRA